MGNIGVDSRGMRVVVEGRNEGNKCIGGEERRGEEERRGVLLVRI